MKFNYQARTKKGEVQSGVIEASNAQAAIALLQKYNLYVTILEQAKSEPIYAQSIRFFERISRGDIVLFSRQLSIMFESEVPLVESLRAIASQTGNSVFREIILSIGESVGGGTSLSVAMAGFPKAFSSFYVSMVKSGEVSGKLSEVLGYLADHLEREYYLVSKIRGAMIYPAFVFVIFTAVLVLMSVFVIPSLSEVLIESGQQLPLITRITLGASAIIREKGIFLAAFFAVFIFGASRYIKSESGKRFFDNFLLQIPLVGNYLKEIYLSRFAENLSTLIAGGLPITKALEVTGEVIGNADYKEIVNKVLEDVRRGENITSVLQMYPDYIPPLFIQMVSVGERTGKLDTTLLNIVNFYQKEVDRSTETFLGLLEPVMIVVMGVFVGGLMASILMPLYSIEGSI